MKEYSDETNDNSGRIPYPTSFKTFWTEDLFLLELFTKYGYDGKFRKADLTRLSRQEKIAISRHKKQLMKKDGLIENQKKVKIIYCAYGGYFYIYNMIEKKKIYISDSGDTRLSKSDCVLWTKEKQRILNKYKVLRSEEHTSELQSH